MFIIKSEIEFDAAHFLSDYDGKCANIHGHRYRLIAKIKRKLLISQGKSRGMVQDFSLVKQKLKIISDLFDHKLIVEDNDEGKALAENLKGYEVIFVPYRPTAEEMSRDIYFKLKELGLDITEVELFETPTNSCTYVGDDND